MKNQFIVHGCSGLNNDPPPYKVVHIPIPRTCVYVILCGEKDFVDVIKDLQIGWLFWIIWVGPV